MSSCILKDYYHVLSLDNKCTQQDIKRSYHQLALIWHPDKHIDKKEASLRFALVSEAYTVLSDVTTRRRYDIQRDQLRELEQHLKEFSTDDNIHSLKNLEFKNMSATAINVLENIFKDKDDDNHFEGENCSQIPREIHSALKSFVNQEIVSSDDEYLLTEYQPTFKNKKFCRQFKQMKTLYQDKDNISPFFATIVEEPIVYDEEEPSIKKKQKAGIIIIEKPQSTRPTAIIIERLKAKTLTKDKLSVHRLKSSLKRPFIYNEESEGVESLPQQKVKRPRMRPIGKFVSASSEDDEQKDLNFKSILHQISQYQPK